MENNLLHCCYFIIIVKFCSKFSLAEYRDSVKRDFLIESVLSCYDLPKARSDHSNSSSARSNNEYAGPSNLTVSSYVKFLLLIFSLSEDQCCVIDYLISE